MCGNDLTPSFLYVHDILDMAQVVVVDSVP